MIEKSETARATSGLKIIGAGFARTGTRSVKEALEELGFGPCYHMMELRKHPGHTRLWEAAARGETVKWREIFKGYQATVDWPACIFYKELMKIYPDTKVLLTVRDPETWYRSVQSTLYGLQGRKFSPFFRLLLRLLFPTMRQRGRMMRTIVWEGIFRGHFADKQYAIEIFNQHIEEVKKYVPPERLLVYNVKEGWEPLCAFLGVEVPKDKPFPCLNDRASFLERREQQLRRAVAQKVLISASTLAILFFVFLRLRKTVIQAFSPDFCKGNI